MKTIATFLVVLSVFGCVICDSSEENSSEEKFVDKLKSVLAKYGTELTNLKSQLEEYCPGAPVKLKNDMKSLMDCYFDIDKSTTVCSAVKQEFLNCTNPIVKTMEECMSERTKGLPTLIANSLFEIIKYLCGLDGEHLFEFYNDCVYNGNETVTIEDENACDKNLTNKLEKLKEKIPSTSDICDVMTEAKPCWEHFVKKMCLNEITRSAWIGAADAIIKPCNSIRKLQAEGFNNVFSELHEESSANSLFHKFNENTYKHHLQQSEFAQKLFSQIDRKCPGASSKLMNAFTSMTTCFSEIDDTITVCAGIRTHMSNCTSGIVAALQDCMPESAKNVPRLAMASILSAFSHTCTLSGEKIFELANDCIHPDESNAAEFAKCRELAREKLEDIQKAPTAAKICSLGNEMKPCFQSYLTASCPNEITRSTWSGMFDALLTPCAGPTGRTIEFPPFSFGFMGK